MQDSPARSPASGPFETEQDARAAVPHIMHVTAAQPGGMGRLSHQLLESACTAAGVTVGAFDHEILLWLARYEPEMCAVVAGLITRAASGHRDPGAPAAPGTGSRAAWKLWHPSSTAEPVCEGSFDQVITAARLTEGPLILDDPLGSDWERLGS